MSTTPTRCGVIGVGRMGRHHARIYSQLPQAELVGVVDADASRREDITGEWGGAPVATVAELIDLGVEAVTIAYMAQKLAFDHPEISLLLLIVAGLAD